LEEPVFDQSREILLAIDLSRSMLTPDVPPSRLARAKLLIQSLLEKLQGERVGLAVFSGTSFLQSPLSADYEILREFLPALGPEFLPEGGTNYRALIDTAIAAFGTSNAADRFLIILSDGEATDDNWKERMPELKTKGIRVIGLGIGTAGGGMIPDGSGGFVKDERGAVVLSKLENATLQELAKATNGVYRDSSSWLDLASLIKETVEAGQKGKFVEKNTVRLVERFQWPLAFGLWCLLVSFFSEFPVRPRPRDIKLGGPTGGPKTAPEKLATTAASLLVLVFLVRSSPSASALQPSAASSTPPTAPAVPPAASLSKIVGRVATAETRNARDWSELGHETVIWGSRLQGEQQPVPEGPVRDALAAVDTGSKLDPKATDWEKLRQDLEALLQKPEDQKQKQDQKQNDQQNKDQKDQQKQDQQDKQNQQKSDQQQQQDKKDQQQQKQDQQNQNSDDQKKPGESAFGDMQKKDQQPPPPPPQDSGTQKVGGQEKKDQQPEQADPSLALPLQKLDQLRNQDSPAQLFQLMDGDKKNGPKKVGKDW
jgi:Ca-activated chloride channel family protein